MGLAALRGQGIEGEKPVRWRHRGVVPRRARLTRGIARFVTPSRAGGRGWARLTGIVTVKSAHPLGGPRRVLRNTRGSCPPPRASAATTRAAQRRGLLLLIALA